MRAHPTYDVQTPHCGKEQTMHIMRNELSLANVLSDGILVLLPSRRACAVADVFHGGALPKPLLFRVFAFRGPEEALGGRVT